MTNRRASALDHAAALRARLRLAAWLSEHGQHDAATSDLLDVLADVDKALDVNEQQDARLFDLGDAMASQIDARWSGPGGCDCPVCSAAAAWRAAREADGA